MLDKKYLYTGPNSGVTIKVPESDDPDAPLVDRDVFLWQGKEVWLPPEHAVTKTLLPQGLLQLVEEPAATTVPTAPTKKADAAPDAATKPSK
jgi:hypothetical protein